MNFTPKTKAWILLVTLIISEGSGVAALAHAGGASLGWSLLAGMGAGCASVYHALSPSPGDKADSVNQNKT